MRVTLQRARRSAGTATFAVGLLCLTSGCTGFLSSQMTDTVDEVNPGSSAHVGSILVRNAFVLGPPPDTKISAGGKAAVYVTLYNRGADQPGELASAGKADWLTAASAGPTARSVRVVGAPIEVPVEQRVNVPTDGQRVVLRGLTRPLSGGENVSLTLRFRGAGDVSFSVPVFPRTEPYASLSPFPSSSPPRHPGTPSPAPEESPRPAQHAEGKAEPRETVAASPSPTAPKEAGTPKDAALREQAAEPPSG